MAGVGLLLWVAGLAVSWSALGRWISAVPRELAAGVVGVLSLLVAAGWSKARSRHRRPARSGGWIWTTVVIVIPVVALTAIALVVLFNSLQPQGSNQIDVVKTALSVGAGTGGVVALVLAGRRQWSTEFDATERRITDLYTKAAEQLGADKDPVVRLTSLYALERLAQDHPDHRQTIVNIICAYLRMPYTPPRTGTTPASGLTQRKTRPAYMRPSTLGTASKNASTQKQELQARLTAQRILSDHLESQTRRTRARHWPGMRLDLTNATLVDFRLINARIHSAIFTGTRFCGETAFALTHFEGHADFTKAVFEDSAYFVQVEFNSSAQFERCHFAGAANFRSTRFDEISDFEHAFFGGSAMFPRSEFAARARFTHTRFAGQTGFDGVRFGDEAVFSGATFGGAASFDRAQFVGAAMLDSAQFATEVSFFQARFNDLAYFTESRFGGTVSFDFAKFSRSGQFKAAQFDDFITFTRARFNGTADFRAAWFAAGVHFLDAEFFASVQFDQARVRLDAAIDREWPAPWREHPLPDGQGMLTRSRPTGHQG